MSLYKKKKLQSLLNVIFRPLVQLLGLNKSIISIISLTITAVIGVILKIMND